MTEKKLEVINEEKSGRNKQFRNTETGEILSVQQVAENIQDYPGYHVVKRDGKLFVRSNPDGNKNNNLE